MIGALLYLATHTRPDISTSALVFSRKISFHTIKDFTEVKRIFKYLKGTKCVKLKLRNLERTLNIINEN